jgi:tRNA(Ile)-lysidine synthetase-like protein
MEGDKINIQNGTKKISRVFIDKKVPEAIRSITPIILDNSNNIIWVYDLIKSDDIYKMKENCDIYLVGEVL